MSYYDYVATANAIFFSNPSLFVLFVDILSVVDDDLVRLFGGCGDGDDVGDDLGDDGGESSCNSSIASSNNSRSNSCNHSSYSRRNCSSVATGRTFDANIVATSAANKVALYASYSNRCA
jgi:hypothetical protein